jgi:hypothetical protein
MSASRLIPEIDVEPAADDGVGFLEVYGKPLNVERGSVICACVSPMRSNTT